jgi:hypothetical protein
VSGGGSYDYWTIHQATATADAGSTFIGWSGDCSGMTNPFDVTMLDRDMTCTATFAINTYTISFSLTGSGAMTCAPTTVSWSGGFECTVSPGSGYYLESLLDNTVDVTAQVSGTSYSVANVTDDHSIQATFQQNLAVLRLWGNTEPYFTAGYLHIQDAYSAASNDDDILTLASDFVEDLNFNLDIAITLQGGWDPDFSSITGWTTLTGNLTISKGAVIAENLILK